MNTQKLKDCVETLQKDLGKHLLSTDIWGSDGLSFASYNSKPATVALFEELTKNLRNVLDRSDLPSLGNYYFITLENNQIFVVLFTKESRWGFLVDGNELNLGLLLGVAVPNALKGLQDAIEG